MSTTLGARDAVVRATTRRTFDVGMLSYGLPAAGLKRGGIERVAHELADGLAERGHRVTVYSYDPAPAGARYAVTPMRGRAVADSWLGRRVTMGYLGNVFALDRRLRRHDVVIAHGDSVLLPLLGRPLIRVMHGSALGEALSSRRPWRIAHQLGVWVQELTSAALQGGTVGVSRSTRRHNPFVRRVIPNGADLSLLHPDPAAKTPEPSLLFVGALDGRKRGRLLLDWFTTRIRPAHPTATMTMLTAEGPPVPGVRYLQGIAPAALARLYREAWVYCSPSTYEGFGLPYVEAMASGTPVVATSNPGSREVLGDGRFGLLPDDDRFADVVLELLGDADARAALAARGVARARDYSLASMLDGYETLMEELCRQ